MAYHPLCEKILHGGPTYVLEDSNKVIVGEGEGGGFTAAAPAVPPPLLAQLAPGGRLIGPVGRPHWVQDLVLLIRQDAGKFQQVVVETVAYIPLRGVYGFAV